jgi:hypothetical protein
MNIESASSSVRQSLKMRKSDSPDEECYPIDHHSVSQDMDGDKNFHEYRLKTVTLINLAGMMERMDEQARHKSTHQSSHGTVPVLRNPTLNMIHCI